jgi:hypothetical protein
LFLFDKKRTLVLPPVQRPPSYRPPNTHSGLEINTVLYEKFLRISLTQICPENRSVPSFNLHGVPDEVFERLRTSLARNLLVIAVAKQYFLAPFILGL